MRENQGHPWLLKRTEKKLIMVQVCEVNSKHLKEVVETRSTFVSVNDVFNEAAPVQGVLERFLSLSIFISFFSRKFPAFKYINKKKKKKERKKK